MILLRFIFGLGVLIHLAGPDGYLPALSEYAIYGNQVRTELVVAGSDQSSLIPFFAADQPDASEPPSIASPEYSSIF